MSAEMATDWAQRIGDAVARCDEVGGELSEVVRLAREDGWSWRQVGDALGVSRQAAQQRFKDVH